MPSSTRTAGNRIQELVQTINRMRPGDVVREMIPPTITIGSYRLDDPIISMPTPQYRERTYDDLMTEYRHLMNLVTRPPMRDDYMLDAMRYYSGVGSEAYQRARQVGRPQLDPILYNPLGVTMGATDGEQSDPISTNIEHDQPVVPVENAPPTQATQRPAESLREAVVALEFHGVDIDEDERSIDPLNQAAQDLTRRFVAVTHPDLIKEITNKFRFIEEEDEYWRGYMQGVTEPRVTTWLVNDEFAGQISSFCTWNRELVLIGAYLYGQSTMEFAKEVYAAHGCETRGGSWPEARTHGLARDSRTAVMNLAFKCLLALEKDWAKRVLNEPTPYKEGDQVYCL